MDGHGEREAAAAETVVDAAAGAPPGPTTAAAASDPPHAPDDDPTGGAAGGSTDPPKKAPTLTERIDQMKAKQQAMVQERKRLTKDLRNAEKKRRRLRLNARRLSNEDLMVVLNMREAERPANAGEPNPKGTAEVAVTKRGKKPARYNKKERNLRKLCGIGCTSLNEKIHAMVHGRGATNKRWQTDGQCQVDRADGKEP